MTQITHRIDCHSSCYQQQILIWDIDIQLYTYMLYNGYRLQNILCVLFCVLVLLRNYCQYYHRVETLFSFTFRSKTAFYQLIQFCPILPRLSKVRSQSSNIGTRVLHWPQNFNLRLWVLDILFTSTAKCVFWINNEMRILNYVVYTDEKVLAIFCYYSIIHTSDRKCTSFLSKRGEDSWAVSAGLHCQSNMTCVVYVSSHVQRAVLSVKVVRRSH